VFPIIILKAKYTSNPKIMRYELNCFDILSFILAAPYNWWVCFYNN